jgi:hypothetical protein
VYGLLLADLHTIGAWVVVIGNGLAGIWSLAAHWLERLRRPALWWFTASVQVAVFVEVALGVGLVGVEDIEAPQFHMFYGFIALVAIGIIYSYRQQLRAQTYLLYGCGGLFLMGLGIRAMVIGPR